MPPPPGCDEEVGVFGREQGARSGGPLEDGKQLAINFLPVYPARPEPAHVGTVLEG